MTNATEIRQIINDLNKAAKAYYAGNPFMTDTDYDKMYNTLVELEKETGIVYSDSPTITVGASAVEYITKAKHDHPMLSLDKVHSANDIGKFQGDHDVVCMFKADGLTISATYIDGKLTKLETRGDGSEGNDVLFHAKSFNNLPLSIKKPGKYTIDGEAVILYNDFNEVNKLLPESERKSNPRNLAAGTMNQLDPAVSKTRRLRFFAWDVIEGGSYKRLDRNLYEAEKLGFSTVAHFLIKPGEFRGDLLEFIRKLAKEMEFPIDGVVFKFDDIAYGKSLGLTGHHPRNAIAYKYEDVNYPTTVVDVDWTVGKTGVIVPTLVFEPVEIDGTIISRASLHNLSIYKKLNPSKGATAHIYKSNGVIPCVDYIDFDGKEEFEIPKICPICGKKIYVEKAYNSESLMCKNQKCNGILLNKISFYVSRNGMNINGISEKILKIFIEKSFIQCYTDLYKLNRYKKDIIDLDGFGERIYSKLIQSIEKSRNDVKLNCFLSALSIPGVGVEQSKRLCNIFTTWDDFINAMENNFDFSSIDNFGEIINKNIYDWYNNEELFEDISNVVSLINFQSNNSNEQNNVLNGLAFVISG